MYSCLYFCSFAPAQTNPSWTALTILQTSGFSTEGIGFDHICLICSIFLVDISAGAGNVLY